MFLKEARICAATALLLLLGADVHSKPVRLANSGSTDFQGIRAADIPRQFKGEYMWRNLNFPQILTLQIDKIEEKGGMIQFSGSHSYGDNKIKIEGTIDPTSRHITIREVDPPGPGWETDGSFEGTISTNLQSIEAVWTTRGTEDKGDLKVQASKGR